MSAAAATARPVRPLRLAHRGDWRVAPENSLAALLAGARRSGSDGVEFDVRLAADGVPVVIHDETLERVQGVARAVAQLDAAELAGHGVPSLAAVLRALPRRAFLDIELKEVVGPETIAVLAAGRGPTPERAVVTSFQADALRRVAALAPGWPLWLNVAWLDEALIAAAVEMGARGLAAEWHAITPGWARRVRLAGLELAAWTVRRRDTFARLGRLGVAAVCVEGAAFDG